MMKHLVLSVMLLCSFLVGCGNSVYLVIEDAKENLQTDAQIEYEENFEENFMSLLRDWNEIWEVTGYSLENDVIVIKSSLDYDWTLEDKYGFGELSYKHEAKLIQIDLEFYDLHTTVYVEYYNEDGERFALLTVTNDDYKIEEIE